MDTLSVEDEHSPPFFKKIPIAIERGEGVYVWDETGKKYIDFTSGWGVTCLGHAHPVITRALQEQSRKIIQNPNSGLTYSPARARLLSLMKEILPAGLHRVFFSNSGAEANDAAIKLARKVTRRRDVVSSASSFHGRTISTASATGQSKHREKFEPLMPNYRFVPYDDLIALEKEMDQEVAAVILEPVQGEGGVNIPSAEYLGGVSELCIRNGSCLIIDEVQTGFCRTGPMFAVQDLGIRIDFLTMAKGIAGGFPFGAFAVSESVSDRIEFGDHGGTYCGNPLGCAVAYAVIRHLIDEEVHENVLRVGRHVLGVLQEWQRNDPDLISNVRGMGLLLAIVFSQKDKVDRIHEECLKRGLFINVVQGNVARIFPALNITMEEAEEGLGLLKSAIEAAVQS
jgi:acetylornithine/N-succinyldiaminopimelate aminotransferase